MNSNLSIIGIGKLGLCFALVLEKAGYNVMGVDLNKNYVNSINQKNLKSEEKDVEVLLKQSKKFIATTSLNDAIQHSNQIFVIVATPSLESGEYDHSQIHDVIKGLNNIGKQNVKKHLIICCTVMPGFCDSIKEKLADLNYDVSYNPEFIAQGTIIQNQENPDTVLIGEANVEIGNKLQEIYKKHTKNDPKICRMTPLEAEITKLSLNCFLTTKIAYTNMIGDIVDKAGGNPDVVLSAIGSDTRVGQKFLKYGFGYGGPCLPRDNRALGVYAKKIGLPAKISEATDSSNSDHLDFMVQRSKENKTIILEKVTYKPESTMLVESQKLKFADKLADLGGSVIIRERKSVIDELKKEFGEKFHYEIID